MKMISVVAVALVLVAASLQADVCVYKPPKVSRACGVIVDQEGQPIPAARVVVLDGDRIVEQITTGDDGEFDLSIEKTGKYDVDIYVPGFQHARYQFTLGTPRRSCTKQLKIEMAVASIHCGGDITTQKRVRGSHR